MLPDFRKWKERATSALYNTEHSRVHLTAKFQEQSLILTVHCDVLGWNQCHSTQLKFRHLKPQSSSLLTKFNTVSLSRILHSRLRVTSHRQPMFRWPLSAGLTIFFWKVTQFQVLQISEDQKLLDCFTCPQLTVSILHGNGVTAQVLAVTLQGHVWGAARAAPCWTQMVPFAPADLLLGTAEPCRQWGVSGKMGLIKGKTTGQEKSERKSVRNTLYWGWQSMGTGCTGRLWSLPPGRHSKPMRMCSCVTHSRWPWLVRGVGLADLQKFLPTLTALGSCETALQIAMSKEMEGRRFFVTGQSLKQTVLMGQGSTGNPKWTKGIVWGERAAERNNYGLTTALSPHPPGTGEGEELGIKQQNPVKGDWGWWFSPS